MDVSLLLAYNQRPIAFNRHYVTIGCGINGALLLSQAIYWTPRTKDKNGWFFKTQKEWEEETGLTRREQENARKRLIQLGILEEKRQGIPCKLFFRIDVKRVHDLLVKAVHSSMHETANQDGTESTDSDGENVPTNTESTSETTPYINNPPNPPRGADSEHEKKRSPQTTFKTFIDQCIANDEKPISVYKPLHEYIESSGLPPEFIQLAWENFKNEFMPGGANENRRQRDWRRHFMNYVTKGYYRLWWAKAADDGSVEYQLTTQGLQTKTVIENRRSKSDD